MQTTSRHTLHALELGPMENFVYLLADESTKTAAVVDPAWDVPAIIGKAKSLDFEITDVLLTHSHNDHINGIDELLNHHDAQVHILKSEATFWGKQLIKPNLHHGGDKIKLGNTEIEIMHTPGHTPGSACYRAENDLITGDTLFVFGCGRCDLHGGNPEQMFTTLKRIKSDLPGEIIIHPGHNYSVKNSSTIREEIDGNPFMHFTEVDRFVRYRMKIHDKIRSSPYSAQKENDLKLALDNLKD